jgi:hypothetical protein
MATTKPVLYSEDERNAIADALAKTVLKELPAEVAFVLVVATQTPEGKSRFTRVSNLPIDRAIGQLLARAALEASEEGVGDVLQRELNRRDPSTPKAH